MGKPEDEQPLHDNDRQPALSYGEEDQLGAPPAYTDAASRSVVLAATKFPPTLNGYKTWRTFYLGPSADDKRWAVTLHGSSFSGKKPNIVLHDGPSDKDPVLATAGSENAMQTRYIISLPGRAGLDGEDLTVRMSAPTIKTSRCRLAIPVGSGGKGEQRLEDFEWRSSHGQDVKHLAGGASSGWKLVRLAGPNSKPGGSSTAERAPGFTSDGREVVALIALNATASRTKMVRLGFLGSGAAGAMGETFEIVALTSALQLWHVFYEVGAV